jgi:AcrR family transcriptional regulator
MREQLIEAGIRLLEEAGPEALQARRVAAEVGASTMTVYTHFDGMPGLLEAIVGEAFARFGAALASIAPTDDAIADFLVMGYNYRQYALANPQRYLLMFGLTPGQTGKPLGHNLIDEPITGIAGDTFEQLVTVVERMITTERIRHDPPRHAAARIWGLIHGVVILELTGQLGTEPHAATTVLLPATLDLLAGMGAERARLELSAQQAVTTIAAEPGRT